MLEFLEYICVRLLLAIFLTELWTVASIVIMAVLHVITKENISDEHFDNYTIITNYILIFLCLVIFYERNIKLF